ATGPAHARARDRPRERGSRRSRRTAALSGPEPRRQRAARHSAVIRYRAAWVVPIAEPPIRDGWVAIDHGRVVATGRPSPGSREGERDLGQVALLPGLV